jgi:hypothetical protein
VEQIMTPVAAAELVLVAEQVVHEDGNAARFELPTGSHTLVCRLEVLQQVEQESLEISIWGSPDGEQWGSHPLVKFPQQFYRGSAQMVVDLSERPEVRFIRARWEVNRWGRGRPVPMFRFRVTARPVG